MAEIVIRKVKEFLRKKEELQSIRKQKERQEVISELEALEEIWEKYSLGMVYLYGSFTDMTFNKYSDIDIAVGPEISFEDLLRLYSEVNREISREVDIRLLKELPFTDKVKKTGVLIYERKNSHS